MFIPVIVGSDKTIASAGTGNVEYWPVYRSVGNVHNSICRAHGDGLVLLGFLAIPKSKRRFDSCDITCSISLRLCNVIATKAHTESADFRRFRRQLFHASLAIIFGSLKPGMVTPEVVKCPNGHFRLVIWGLGPYIADYPEQVLLCCIVQGWCPRYVSFSY